MDQPIHILVTGGTGYIGSHTCVALIERGFVPILIDNLSNSYATTIECIRKITGHVPIFYESNINNEKQLNKILQTHPIRAAIHLAGFKAVGESVADPLRYYLNNVESTLQLMQALKDNNVKTMIFSSSATVYGNPKVVPITEEAPISPTNPYGQSKAVIEKILQDVYASDSSWRIGILRYFNPAGAHKTGLIGEMPIGAPNNLIPYIAQVAAGKRAHLKIYGNDYPTPDGTGIRDYIHIMDLAEGHVSALEYLLNKGEFFTVNLGTGRGYSVLEAVKTFESIIQKPIPYVFSQRRPGDVATCYANPNQAFHLLGWKARLDLEAMCSDTWRHQRKTL